MSLMKSNITTGFLLAAMLVVCWMPADAQEATVDAGSSAVSAEAQANNPLAEFAAFNLHNYYIPELSGDIDATANNFVLRYAQPFGKWLMRASLPFARVPTGTSTTTSGLGDLDVFFCVPV